MTQELETAQSPKSKLRCRASGAMAEWLASAGGSLAISTYTSGRLVFVSSIGGKLRFLTRQFVRPMGLAAAEGRLALAVREQILHFGQHSQATDLFTARREYNTGRVDAHDVAFGKRGIYFANTRYNCVARVSSSKQFVHCWQPKFVNGVLRGDRCHLNGLGMRDGELRVATAFCATGHEKGWREGNRFTSGVLIDTHENRILTKNLCMPHSPRWHEGRWWLCNSGHGTIVALDPVSETCEEICALPGFTRGLTFIGDYALVGLSRIRRKHILNAPPLRRQHEKISPGVALVNWRTGEHAGTLEFLDGGREVYDVVFLSGCERPRLIYSRSAAGHVEDRKRDHAA